VIKVLGVIFISLLIAIKEIPPLKKQKMNKEVWIFSFFQLFATILLSLVLLEVKIPSPLEVIRVVYQPFSDALFSLLS
jgi:hypothetical protein